MELSFRRTRPVRVDSAVLKKLTGRQVVWWYGPIMKNIKDGSVPLVIVFFRRLLDDGTLAPGTTQVPAALTHLGQLRIGSVWVDGMRQEDVAYAEETFDLNFSDNGWKFTSALEDASLRALLSPSSIDGYPLQYHRDQNVLLDFSLPDGRRLVVPCMEFFTRCYGRSAEVRRVLATYSWEEGRGRLFKPLDEPVQPGFWPVNLARRMHNDDVVFLAHIEYSGYTRDVVKGVYAQADAAFAASAGTRSHAFLKIQPWFTGAAQLRVEGIWLEAGRTFLALRITGESQPKGEKVIRNRESPDGFGRLDGSGDLGPDAPARHLRRLPEIVDLTSNEAPDHGALPIDIADDGMAILGEPRDVIDRKHAVERGLARNIPSDQDIRVVSTGESYGNDKGAGYGAIHAPVVLESHGMLRDMWDAAHKLQENSPDIVQAVGAFTFEDGIRLDSEPKLVPLELFGPDDVDVGNGVRNWVYYDRKAPRPRARGVLVMLVWIGKKIVCLVEVERREILRKGDGDEEATEESFSGLVFTLKHEEDLSMLVPGLLEQIRRKRGIAFQVIDALGWELPVFAFKHVPAKGERYPCETAVRNALKKVGVIVPKPNRDAGNS